MSCRTRRNLLGLTLVLGPAACGDDLTATEASDSEGPSSSSSSSGALDETSTGDETTDASTGVEAGPKCGNGLLEADEDCDDGNTASNDGCSKLCQDEFCGDGIQQTSEACDLGPGNADTATCTTACQPNVCGDGLQGPAETCDDGNTDDDDGCGADCTLETCGNGELEASEVCDDGNRDNDDACTTLCAPPVCGDGIVSPSLGENCDDANPEDTDACPNDCTESVCGDGVLEGPEECDEADLNGDGTSLCSPECTLNVCGDGYLVPDLEVCDDGNATGDGVSDCTPQCTTNLCGDAYHHFATEGCDAGDRNGYVPCSTSCGVVPEVVQVEFADLSACAVYSDGMVRCWGDVSGGRLAIEDLPDLVEIGDAPGEMPPPAATLGGPVVQVASGVGSGGDSWCALRTDGSVVCWGSGRELTFLGGSPFYSGLLGPLPPEVASDPYPYIGDDPGELPPNPIPLGTPAVSLSVADRSACIVGEDETLRCWGTSHDDFDETPWPTLGYGLTTTRAAPEEFPPPPVNLGVGVTAANHTTARTCTLGTDLAVRCFGMSSYGGIGLGGPGPAAEGNQIAFPDAAVLEPATYALGSRSGAMCSQQIDGSIRCFGFGISGTLGYESTEHVGDGPGEMPPPPVNLGPVPVAKLSAGWPTACALFENGAVRCWGGTGRTWGYGGPFGVIGDEPGEMPPPELNLDGPVIDLFTTENSRACVIYEDHSVACWGTNILGLENGYPPNIGDNPGEMPPPLLRLYP